MINRLMSRNCCSDFYDIFSRGPFDVGRTSLVEHTIDTGTHRPIRQGLSRHPIAHEELIDQEVNELLRNDFIEPAASPWASNVVMVHKDGTYRMCVDYRSLNSISSKDSYPLPHIDVCMSSMNGASWSRTFDLRSGYFNTGVFNLWSPVVRGELPRNPRATPEKLETRRILTKQKYQPYQCCRYRLQRTLMKTSLVFAMVCLKSELD